MTLLSTPRYLHKRKENAFHPQTYKIFIVTLFIITKNWNESRYFTWWMDKKKKKWWYIPTMEYFSLIKNEQPT